MAGRTATDDDANGESSGAGQLPAKEHCSIGNCNIWQQACAYIDEGQQPLQQQQQLHARQFGSRMCCLLHSDVDTTGD